MVQFHATTICAVRRGPDDICIGGDGQVTMGESTIMKNGAKKVRKILIQKGYHVLLTRETDEYISLKERVDIANRRKTDIYVSIHQNAFKDSSIHGIETWYSKDKGEDNEVLASLLHSFTIENTGAKKRYNNGNSEMYTVINTNMPACIVETGFISNTLERKKLVTNEYQDILARSIADAIESYFLNHKQLQISQDVQDKRHLR